MTGTGTIVDMTSRPELRKQWKRERAAQKKALKEAKKEAKKQKKAQKKGKEKVEYRDSTEALSPSFFQDGEGTSAQFLDVFSSTNCERYAESDTSEEDDVSLSRSDSSDYANDENETPIVHNVPTKHEVQVDSDYDDEEELAEALTFEDEAEDMKKMLAADFQCLSQEEIVATKERETSEVAELLNLPLEQAGVLLRHFKWNKERLLAAYLENPAAVARDAGLVSQEQYSPGSASKELQVVKEVAVTGDTECSICGEEKPPCEVTGLACGHTFCNDCWETYLTMKITEGQASRVRCPHFKCGLFVEEATVRRLVPTAVYEKYVKFLTKSFIEDNSQLKWCPAPGCERAINAKDVVRRGNALPATVQCACGHRFCLACGGEAHLPASCDQVKLWNKKCHDSSETDNWIAANTKECPKCKLAIEKNGGCNHMVCRQCKHEFCWMCLGAWKGHNNFYTCNKYVKTEEKAKAKKKPSLFSRLLRRAKKGGEERLSKRERERIKRENYKKALERYLWYYHRFINHHQSSQHEGQLRARALEKMRQLSSVDATWGEVQFIAKATEELLECRSALKWSYVFAFYLSDGPAKNIFEYLQEDLEKTTEALSAALEATENAAAFDKQKRLEVENLTGLAKRRLNNLFVAVEQGLTGEDS